MSARPEDKALVWRLREAARLCSNVPYAASLRNAADRLQVVTFDFWEKPNEENMRTLNGVWVNCERILKNVPPEGTPDPTSGDPEPARLAP